MQETMLSTRDGPPPILLIHSHVPQQLPGGLPVVLDDRQLCPSALLQGSGFLALSAVEGGNVDEPVQIVLRLDEEGGGLKKPDNRSGVALFLGCQAFLSGRWHFGIDDLEHEAGTAGGVRVGTDEIPNEYATIGHNQHSLWFLGQVVDVVAPHQRRQCPCRCPRHYDLPRLEEVIINVQVAQMGKGVIGSSEVQQLAFVADGGRLGALMQPTIAIGDECFAPVPVQRIDILLI